MYQAMFRAVFFCMVIVWSVIAQAQTYPSRPIRIVVPFAAGGPNDFIARVIGQKLTERWGQPVVIDNRGGAGGNIGTAIVARAAPDGYTLALVSTAFVVNPSLYTSVEYDVFKDFAPVTLAALSPVIIVAHPTLPIRDVRSLVQLAKDSRLNYASPGAGTTGHLGGELFNAMAGLKMQHVPYKGAGPAISDLLGGQIQLGFMAVPPAAPHIRSGRLRAIAVTTLKRTAALPDVPTVAESGYSNFSVDNMYAVIAPRGTPPAVIDRLQSEISSIIRIPEIADRLTGQGFDPVGSKPALLADYFRSEFGKWRKIVTESGARVD